MRANYLLLPLIACIAAPALAGDAPYYGPMKKWHGIGYKFGVEDAVQADGSWRIDAATHGREATEMAMYRAAERARDEGYAYVEMLGGSATQGPGRSTATLYARPSRSAARPALCWKNKPKGCYTADVGAVLRRLGGPDGRQPGVALASGTDEYGRSVSYGGVDFGFGVGAVPPATATPTPTPAAPVRPRAAAAVPVLVAPGGIAPVAAKTAFPDAAPPRPAVARSPIRWPRSAADRFAQALKEVQPVDRDAKLGWTIGD